MASPSECPDESTRRPAECASGGEGYIEPARVERRRPDRARAPRAATEAILILYSTTQWAACGNAHSKCECSLCHGDTARRIDAPVRVDERRSDPASADRSTQQSHATQVCEPKGGTAAGALQCTTRHVKRGRPPRHDGTRPSARMKPGSRNAHRQGARAPRTRRASRRQHTRAP